MASSSVADFVKALKSDPALKARVEKAQREAMVNIRREADAIAPVASWRRPPTSIESAARCIFR